MKTNELCTDLRIGNWVKCDNLLCKVVEIYSEDIYCYDQFGEDLHNIEYIQPIELTEEVLLKIGFDKHDEAMNIYAFENERAIVVYVPNRKLLKIEGVENGVLIDRNIRLNNVEHLHQLQNAYYLLTGQELNIEL